MSTPRRPQPPRARISAKTGPGAVDLLEESVHRLRSAPAGVLALYFLGSLPFVLGLLYFWTDLGGDPDASRHVVGGALAMTALFFWMKFCHAAFASGMRARFARRPTPPPTAARLLRMAAVQTILHATGVVVLPLAAIATVPLGWVYAFYQNVTALGDGETGSTRAVAGRAMSACALWPKQNHVALGLLSLLGLFVWMNIINAVFTLPQLLRQFTGEENVFTRSGMHLWNTTFLAVTVCLVWLALDPLIKTFYALRCFYGDALRSGEDLKSELLALPPPVASGAQEAPPEPAAAAPGKARAPALATLALGLCLLALHASAAQGAPPPTAPAPAPAAVSPEAMRQSIEDVLKRREFVWRQPHDGEDAAGRVLPVETPTFLDGLRVWLRETWASFSKWLGKLLRRWFSSRSSSESSGVSGLGGILRVSVYGLIALSAGAILYLIWQGWQNRRRRPELAGRAATAAAPDLADDQVLASQLPEDEWLALARKLLAKGERRLALRAFYLSTLASLGGRGLLAIARHKSNRDYLEELRRRARDLAETPNAFARNVRRFERVWYGRHPASEELLADFLADREAIAAETGAPGLSPA